MILGRSTNRTEFEKQLEHLAPQKKILIRANAYTCTAPGCFSNGRNAPSKLCTACGGTGYTGVTTLPNNAHLMTPPAAQVLFFYGDLQPGHGLYGSGGDFIRSLVDLGKIELGDATLFTKVQEIDRQTGNLFYPDVVMNNARPRPDWVKTIDGTLYTVTKNLLINFGDEELCRMIIVDRGAQGAGAR